MIKELTKELGRFSVDFEVVNYRDLVASEIGALDAAKVRRARLRGVVDTGASHLVLPAKTVKQLGLARRNKV